ncbi:MAG: hypothetical protein SFV81_20355 [Pirellulaceae bacterium]|nr:hypothetical protein [Pirellulaceae bacterium]
MSLRSKVLMGCLCALIVIDGGGCRGTWEFFDVDRCATIPSGAIPAPVGTHVNAWQDGQVASAAKDRGVFYQNEFLPKSAELSPSGREHVVEAVQQSLYNSVPIVVEQSSDPALDGARLQTVHATFASAGVVLAPEQIFVAKPAAHGFDGFRAQQAVRSSMINGGGGMAGGGGMGGGGMGGGGMGGGGGGMGGGGFGGGGIF